MQSSVVMKKLFVLKGQVIEQKPYMLIEWQNHGHAENSTTH